MNSAKIKNYFDFLWAMTEKEIKARYKHTVFGFLWVILNPILQMLVIGFIFSFFVKIPVNNYYLFLFTGLLPWQFFSLSLTKATSSFVFERSLLQKSYFPREAIPFSIILSNFFHFIVSLLLLILFLLVSQNLLVTRIVYLIPASLLLLLFTTSFSLLTSTLQVKYRDINFFVQSLLTLWFYATPIIYNLDLIPQKLRLLYYLNPLSYIFELFHASAIQQLLPRADLLLFNLLIITIITIIAVVLYKKEHKYFVDWL